MRAVPALAAVAALGLALLNLTQLLARAYADRGDTLLDQPSHPQAVPAASHAAGLTPWSPARLALHGWLLSEQGDLAAADARYRAALRWAPGDALLWTEYALVLGRHGELERMTLPLQRANALGAAVPAVQASVAAIGVRHWEAGSAAARKEWWQSIAYEMRHHRATFLDTVAARGETFRFCDGPGRFVKGATQWCRRAGVDSQPCARPDGEERAACPQGG